MTPQRQIEQLARAKLLGNRIDAVGFVDQLLALATREGDVHCECASNDALRFTVSGQPGFEVPVDAAHGKLRAMCARLAKLCQENGQEFMVYGGEGTICTGAPAPRCSANLAHDGATHASGAGGGDVLGAEAALRPVQRKVRHKNTMSEHEFTIEKA